MGPPGRAPAKAGHVHVWSQWGAQSPGFLVLAALLGPGADGGELGANLHQRRAGIVGLRDGNQVEVSDRARAENEAVG
jgi:hypothetical protein